MELDGWYGMDRIGRNLLIWWSLVRGLVRGDWGCRL